MTFRKFDTGTWQDPWFEGLSQRAKLAFIYLWTNEKCNQAGFYEISERRIKFDLGYGIDTISSELNTRIEWDQVRNLVWVKNFFRHQCQNSKFAISALNSISNDPYRLQGFIQYNKATLKHFKVDLSAYHIDTIKIPYPTEAEAEAEAEADKNLFVEDSDEFRLAEKLSQKILENNPKAKKPNLQKWAKQIDYMLRLDNRKPEEIEAIIEWCQKDSFWMTNILSTKKLRKNYDQLTIKMKSNGKNKHPKDKLTGASGSFKDTKYEGTPLEDIEWM